MEAFTLQNLSFSYPKQPVSVLKGLSFSVEKGQFITLCGKSGCGKTTLLRQLKPALTPHGVRTGTILFDGEPLETLDFRTQSERIGFVLQSPDSQLVTDKVWHELAFGLESLGYPTETIRLRTAEMASFFGIQTWFHQSVSELSGGQKQLLNLASVMALQPSVLLLDEPTSQLDPIAASDFLAALGKINRELGVTVLLSEHRLEEALPLSDRCIVLDGGEIIADGAPAAVGAALRGHDMFPAMPTPMRVWAAVPEAGNACPVTVREGRAWLAEYGKHRAIAPLPPPENAPAPAPPWAVELDDVWFRYEKDGPDIVKGLRLSVPVGALFAVVGGNGAGKTTALSLISGLHAPYRGAVRLEGRTLASIPEGERFGGLLGVLPQDPKTLFVKKTVELDLAEMVSGPDRAERVQAVAALCELGEDLLTRHPYDLSGGEQQRAALAKVLLTQPQILLLDEPTKGLDAHFKQRLARILLRLTAEGRTIVMVSHDVEFCARYATQCALFFDGAVVTQGPPRQFFSGNNFYTTAANRMARGMIPEAVTAEDIAAALGSAVMAQIPPPPPPKPPMAPVPPLKPPAPPAPPPEAAAPQRERRPMPKRTLAAAVMILLLIPLTLFLGYYFLGNRKYYFISLLVVLETMLPFFLIFEGRRPQARELVVIATLCAIAVAGRAAFFFAPEVKPVAAIVIISAVALGAEAGFLVGAVSMLASNMFFVQGPWTPFQMFAMGLIGFLAGAIFRRLPRERLALCIYGGVSVFFLYGIIMNTYSVFQVQSHVTWGMILVSCAMGMPMDAVHALSTVVFLALAGPALLDKLERIKVKYGLIEPN